MNNTDDKASFNTSIQKVEEFPVSFPADYQPREEEDIHLRDYLHVLLRRKWTVITFFTVVVTTVLIATFLTKPTYRSTAIIKIDKENPNVLAFKDVYAIERMEDDYYQTQYKILKSRNLARRVIRATVLDQHPEFVGKDNLIKKAEANSSFLSDLPENSNTGNSENGVDQKIIDGFLSKVTIEPQQRSRLVKVSFDSFIPALSAKVTNAIARSFIDFNFESKFNASQQARDWLEKQLDDMKAKVEGSEEKLNEYASKKGIIFVTEGDTGDGKNKQAQNIVTKKLAELSTHLVEATADRISREALHRESQQGDIGSSSIVLSSSLIQTLKKESASMEAEYSQLSKVYKPDYPKMIRLEEQINRLKIRIDDETKRIISGIKKDFEAALKRENYLKATLENYKKEVLDFNDKMVQYQILKRETETNRELYNSLLQRLKETGISASLTASNIQILDRAEVPRSPYKPNKKMNLLLAIITGLFGGIGLAFFVEYLDSTVKTPDDVEKRVLLPSLGLVPNFAKHGSKNIKLITLEDKKSPLSEAYRSIGTYIQFSTAVKPPRTILITSPRQGEGKTTTALNTAISLANSYGKGIIVDADLRRPSLHKLFDLDNSKGLSALLTGNIEFNDSNFIQKTKVPNLDIITSGIIPPNPSELLTSYKMRDLISELLQLYSFIVLDSPPVLGLSDSLILNTLTDGVIMVVRAGNTPREAAIKAKKLLLGVNARILGVVLNGIMEADLKYSAYSYYYSYYYEDGYDGDNTEKEKRDRDKA